MLKRTDMCLLRPNKKKKNPKIISTFRENEKMCLVSRTKKKIFKNFAGGLKHRVRRRIFIAG